MADAVSCSLRLLDDAINEHKPTHVFALFSGGHDSLVATAITAKHPAFTAAVHINTGVGIEETHEFVRETCGSHGWPLIELGGGKDASEYTEYELMVLEYGFPGPAQHTVAYVRLKERQLDELVRRYKRDRFDRIMLTTGVRKDESLRRMVTVDSEKPVERTGAKVWVSLIHDWTKKMCNSFIELEGLSRNPVVDKIHMSGECKCGAFASRGEREEDRFWFPEFAAYLDALEQQVEEAGQHGCIWGTAPPAVHKDQIQMFSRRQMLCSTCEWRHSDEDAA